MKASDLIIILPILILLIIAGIFIGSITGQAVRGEITTLSNAEFTIILTAFIVAAEFAIITFIRRKKDNVSIPELVKEARKETY